MTHFAEVELVHLYEEEIGMCKGCCACLIAGSAGCPSHEDAAGRILNKMLEADGVIYVTPNYALQIPAGLKNLLDRLSFVFHRPRLFGKRSMTIVVEGVYGGRSILKYMDQVMEFWGMKAVKGTSVTGGVYPGCETDLRTSEKNNKKIDQAIQRFLNDLHGEKLPDPSLMRVVMFRAARASMRSSPDALPADKAYFEEKGWFDSPYYYEARLNPIQLAAGAIVDGLIGRKSQ